MTESYNIFSIISNQCVILSYVLLSWQFQSTALTFLELSSEWCFLNALNQFLSESLITTSVMKCQRTMINANKETYLIKTEYSILNIHIKYLVRAFSFTERRYCWCYILFSFESHLCAQCYTVEWETLLCSVKAVYVLNLFRCRSSVST